MKPESVPPETVTSEATKLVDASLRLKVSVAVCPALSETWLAVNEIVGGVRSSDDSVTLLSENCAVSILLRVSAPSVPIPSVNVYLPELESY